MVKNRAKFVENCAIFVENHALFFAIFQVLGFAIFQVRTNHQNLDEALPNVITILLQESDHVGGHY